ncbi:GntR family transcriptional regulator [Pelomonas aquatica]|uniref:GntR family transcriptional regulator n=1 Tax=Pelomonas aquatica TaxID=431058 RepID=A0ABU1Z4N6_9BURK|nr:GntR family transcriptional regulator [Pelomonas aquatica]MDR7295582.1 GntR family transcriptional regulator [Pelomonas aquatica]
MPSPPAFFDIQPQLATPIYRQVVEQVQRLVAGGQLGPGDELPSVRNVAERHAINPMTVSKAYSLLEAEGLLERRRGVGMAVAKGARASHARGDRLAMLEPAVLALARQARQLGIAPDQTIAALSRALQSIEQDDNA